MGEPVLEIEEESLRNEDNVLEQNNSKNLLKSALNLEDIFLKLAIEPGNHRQLACVRFGTVLSSVFVVLSCMYVDYNLFHGENAYLKFSEITSIGIIAISIMKLFLDDYITSYIIKLENKRIADLGISPSRKKYKATNLKNYSESNLNNLNYHQDGLSWKDN